MRLLIALTALAVLLVAAGGSSELQFSTVAQGTHSGAGAEELQVLKIESQAEWEALWSQHTVIVLPAPPLPVVDFSEEMVIAAFDQRRPTSGYEIEITSIRAKRSLTVRVERSLPGKRCGSYPVMTQPFHIVRLPAEPGELKLLIHDGRAKPCR